MLIRRGGGIAGHHQFHQLPGLLPEGSLLVVNNTRVLPRKLRGKLPGGGAVEALLVADLGEGSWSAQVKRAKRIREGMSISFAGGELTTTALRRTDDGCWILAFHGAESLNGRLERLGLAPLPPYIRREGPTPGQDSRDIESYQTCYASAAGAIAAPTAGLHFTPNLLDELGRRGMELVELTLHVGLGTFTPIKTEDPGLHRMHREWYELPERTAQRIRQARTEGRPVIAVGTTSVRALESWAAGGHTGGASGWSDLFIRPPHEFSMVDGLITNFHQPRSTLMLMVSAFHGRERLLAAYAEAIKEGYRFFSFGDSMAILPTGR